MPGNRSYLAIGFDMDGTLLRTDVNYSKLSKAVYDKMVSAGVPECLLSLKESSLFNMDSGVSYLINNNRAGDVDKLIEDIRRDVDAVEIENVSTAKQFEGGERMIRYLKNKGYKIGVLTRGGRKYATKALTVAGVIDQLDALVCRDDHHESEAKPSPAAMGYLAAELGVRPSDILYLGDHRMDYFCARDSGAGFIGVLTRYDKKDWEAVDPDINVIGTVADLIGIL